MKDYTKKTIEFYDKNTKAYIKSGAIVLKDKIGKFIESLSGEKILDVACGPGHDTNYLAENGLDCLGVDLSKKMISYAKKNHKGKFEIMDFFDLKFKENEFDGIWCSSAITHTDKKDLDGLLLNFLKILKTGGVLGIIVPRNQKRKQKIGDTRIFTMFEEKELKGYLIKNNFEILDSEIFPFNKMDWIFIVSKK